MLVCCVWGIFCVFAMCFLEFVFVFWFHVVCVFAVCFLEFALFLVSRYLFIFVIFGKPFFVSCTGQIGFCQVLFLLSVLGFHSGCQ